jgi:hypothetical protein
MNHPLVGHFLKMNENPQNTDAGAKAGIHGLTII